LTGCLGGLIILITLISDYIAGASRTENNI